MNSCTLFTCIKFVSRKAKCTNIIYGTFINILVEEPEEVTDEPVPCGGCGGATDACHCQAITNTFCQVNKSV